MKAILLVTGSRAYPGSRIAVVATVLGVLKDFAKRNDGCELVLMHGACPHPATDVMGQRSVW